MAGSIRQLGRIQDEPNVLPMIDVLLVLLIICLLSMRHAIEVQVPGEAERSHGVVAEMSVPDTARARVGAASLLVEYGRPLARGRELVGNVIPFDAVWRTGANAATQFTTSAAITLAGLELAPGTYTLWTLATRSGVKQIVNKQFKQWGTQYDSTKDLGRAALTTKTVTAPVERFTISVLPGDTHSGTLVLEWGSFRWTAPIRVK